MTYKSKKNWKDLVEFSHSHGMSRRELLRMGLATGAMSVAYHGLFLGGLIEKAYADTMNCPAPVRNPGAIGQLFSEGGPTMGARFIGEAQAALMSAGMASNYGISGQANLMKLGPNMVIDKTSPFGITLLQGPPGYAGGAAAWQTNVLSKISGGAHLGQFNQDDGAGVNTGLLGGVSPFKKSQMGKDLAINVRNSLAAWAAGLPAAAVSKNNLAPSSFANAFSLVPAANGLTNSDALAAASDAANSLSAALSPVLNTTTRKGSKEFLQSAGCAFYGNSALADPNYGSKLFNPTGITALTSKLTVNQLSNQEQALLAGYYQSAMGVAGGVILELNGRDYHGSSPQNVIAPADIEEARAIVMFLAACDAAQAPGAMMYFSNGQAIAKGVQSVNANINGTNMTMNAPVASGDAGGAYNAGLIIFYSPTGSPPAAAFTGTVDSNGSARIDAKVGSSKEAVAGLYLSALKWINGGSVPQAAISAMQNSGVAANPSNIMVI
jgi:hypothetical protein